MDEESFIRMLKTALGGLWHDGVSSWRHNDQDDMVKQVLSHLQEGVKGTPAEGWLKRWLESRR